MDILQLRKKTGMNRKEFAEFLQIPYRTVEDWEMGKSNCKDYIVRALYYQLLYLKKISKSDSDEI